MHPFDIAFNVKTKKKDAKLNLGCAQVKEERGYSPVKGGDGSGGIVEERRPCLSVPLMCSWCCSYNKETKKQRYFTKSYKKRLSFQTEITVCLQEGTN